MLRSCYRTKVQFFKDSNATTDVQWFFTDLPQIPFPTLFGSRNWDADNGEWLPTLGEVPGELRLWKNGRRPGQFPGGHVCGTADQWLNGCLLADRLHDADLEPDGVPKCCWEGKKPPAKGGLVLGGSSVVPAPAPTTGGGLLLGGGSDVGMLQTGIIVGWGNPEAPAGWVLCDGSAYSRTDPRYATLFAVIGETFGAGDGLTTFNVPDLRGRGPVGAGGPPPLPDYQLGQEGNG